MAPEAATPATSSTAGVVRSSGISSACTQTRHPAAACSSPSTAFSAAVPVVIPPAGGSTSGGAVSSAIAPGAQVREGSPQSQTATVLGVLQRLADGTPLQSHPLTTRGTLSPRTAASAIGSTYSGTRTSVERAATTRAASRSITPPVRQSSPPATAVRRPSRPPSPRSTIVMHSEPAAGYTSQTPPSSPSKPVYSSRFQPTVVSTLTAFAPSTVPLGSAPNAPTQPWVANRITPPRSPRSTLAGRMSPTVPTRSTLPTQTRVLAPGAVSISSPPPPPTRVVPVRMTSMPVAATAQATIHGDGYDEEGAVAVCTAWADGYPGYPYGQRIITTQMPVVSRPPQAVGGIDAASTQLGTPGLLPRDAAGLHWGLFDTHTWELCGDVAGQRASAAAEANSIDAALSGSTRSAPTQGPSFAAQTRPESLDSPPVSNRRFEALEARCNELEQRLRGKDDQISEMHELAKRTAQQLERKEREVEELRIGSMELTQKLADRESETAAASQRAEQLEIQVQRLGAFRDEFRDERELSDFSRAVSEVNTGRRRGEVPVVEANLMTVDRELPTLAALRNRLYDHKEAHGDRNGVGGKSSARRTTPRTGSTASTASQNQRSGSTTMGERRTSKRSEATWR